MLISVKINYTAKIRVRKLAMRSPYRFYASLGKSELGT